MKTVNADMVVAMEEMIRACGSGMNWMEQVDRAHLSSATRGILHVDMGMCSSAIAKARKAINQFCTAHGGPGNASRQSPGQESQIKDLPRPIQPPVIDTNSDAWTVFCGHWFVSEGFEPHQSDSRVLRAWVWFRAGESWGERKKG